MFSLDILVWTWITSKIAFITSGSTASLLWLMKFAIIGGYGATAFEALVKARKGEETKSKK